MTAPAGQAEPESAKPDTRRQGRRRRLLAWLLTPLILLAGILALAWWQAPGWLPPLAESLARKAGVKITELQIGRPGLRGWVIPRITIDVDGNQFALDDVVLGWRCCEQIESSLTAEIGLLQIALPASDHSDTPATPVALSALLQTLYQRIPFVSVTLDRMQLTGLELPAWNGELSAELERLQGKLDLTIASRLGPEPLTMELGWQSPDRLTLQLDLAASSIKAEGQLNDQGNWDLQGPYLLEPLGLYPVLTGAAAPEAVDMLLGKGVLKLALPDVIGSNHWQLALDNDLIARTQNPSIRIEGKQQLQLTGTSAPDSFSATLEPLRIQLPASLLPANFVQEPELLTNWQLSLNKTLECRLPLQSACLGALPIRLSNQGSAVTVNVSSQADIGALLDAAGPKQKVVFTLDALLLQEATHPLALAPRSLTLQGAYELAFAPELVLRSRKPSQLTWQGLPLGERILLDTEATLNNLSVARSADSVAVATELDMSAGLWRKAKNRLNDRKTTIRLKAPVSLKQNQLRISEGLLNAFGLEQLAEASFNLNELRGWVSLNGGGKLRDWEWIQKWLPPTEAEYVVTPGTLAHTSFVNVSLQPELTFQGRSQLQVSDWGATMEPREIRGLSLYADAQFSERDLRLQSPLKVTLKSALAGIPLKDMRTEVTGALSWGPQLDCRLNVRQASLKLFEGTARLLKPVPVTCPLKNADIPIEVRDLNLSQLVAVENEKVVATGNIAGFLPLKIEDGHATVTGGQVAAQGPGIIKLREVQQWRQLAGGNQAVMFAVNALEDFRYSALTSRVDFTREEKLLLGMSMQGHNPAVQQGRDIVYNLNVESNIVSLLRSVEMTDELVRRIEERVGR